MFWQVNSDKVDQLKLKCKNRYKTRREGGIKKQFLLPGSFLKKLLLYFIFWFFETEFLYVSLAVLELAL